MNEKLVLAWSCSSPPGPAPVNVGDVLNGYNGDTSLHYALHRGQAGSVESVYTETNCPDTKTPQLLSHV